MLPEKWEKLYLYASVIERFNQFQTGEMFFYYFPKGVLKKRPINVYEVPKKFNIDEDNYFSFADELYGSIKNLREACIENNEKAWSNITIIIENLKYKAIYNYDDLTMGEFDVGARRVIWLYRYLSTPYELLNRNEREIIDKYKRMTKPHENTFELPLYKKELNKNIQTIKAMEKKLEFVTDEKIEEIKFKNTHVPKSQILNSK